MSERWLPVPGYEGMYSVSDQGRVRSLDRTVNGRSLRGQLRKPTCDPRGRRVVSLSRDGKSRYFFVHRIVLEAFVGPRPPGMECCHFNDDRSDNRLENLRWDTSSSNRLDAVRNGKHHEARKTRCDKGHEFTEDNTGTRTDNGGRYCRTCKGWKSATAA